jgi:four helix bundle protein
MTMTSPEPGSKRFDLKERLIDFCVRTIRVAESLPNTKTGNHFRGQLLRSGTSPAANYAEAQSAESRSDFIHKIKIVLKELRETEVWLILITLASLIKSEIRLQPLLQECDELIAIFVQSVKPAQQQKMKNT